MKNIYFIDDVDRVTMNRVADISSQSRVKKLKASLNKAFSLRKYDNLIDALFVSKIIRKLFGVLVLDLEIVDGNITSKLSLLGLLCFFLWYSMYFYCAYKASVEDQTILRHMYNTTVQRYGDICERVLSVLYVLLAMWKIPFCLGGNSCIVTILIKVDKALENIGEKINYNRDAFSASAISVGQVIVYMVRLMSIWLTLKHISVSIPVERMYQMVFSDTLALIVTAYYCYFLVVLTLRYRYTNQVLLAIATHKAWEYKIFVRGKMPTNVQKAGSLQDKYLSDKIRSCARIYGMLYKVVVAINDTFGLVLVVTMLSSLIYVILYLFYLMVATAAGLFHDPTIFIHFAAFVLWQATYAVGILYLIVYFCECLMREAKETSYIVHEIMSSDLSPSITTEAMQLSLQLLHQQPVLTAYGLYNLNYAVFEQGARSVSTYIVILLQFVNDAHLT